MSESGGATGSTGAVAWDTAERVADWVGSRSRLPAPYRPDLLQRDFEELTAQAEELVAASTGLRSSSGPARARVTDRAGWVEANIGSFKRLLAPITERLAEEELTWLSTVRRHSSTTCASGCG